MHGINLMILIFYTQRKFVFSFCVLLLAVISAQAQSTSMKGNVMDTAGNALPYVTITLLHPADSTLAYFAVSTTEGQFELKNVSPGTYILQLASLGYNSMYRSIQFPGEENEKGMLVVLKPKVVNLQAAEISSERIPILLKKDTIEYDAGAFKTAPDASAEELLKKLPGVQVDRNGNIKAQGEDVNNVLVDGKEFFSGDPKIATKNLPADAVKKVQVYDEKSDQSTMTGIADGERNKTINLELKDDKKNAWLGEVQAGGGTDDHFQASGKVYRFSGKNQIAVLGMLNNINQFGFSFRDYMDFNGGLGVGESFRIHMDDNVPVNFGQPVYGKIASGASGFNYSYEAKKDRRFSFNYLANGSNKTLDQSTRTVNYLASTSFTTNENLRESDHNRAHRFNLTWKNKIDSTQNLRMNARMSLSKMNQHQSQNGINEQNGIAENSQQLNSSEKSTVLNGSITLSYLKIWESKWKLVRVKAEGTVNNKKLDDGRDGSLQFSEPLSESTFSQYRSDLNNGWTGKGTLSVMRDLGKDWYLEPAMEAGWEREALERKEGVPPLEQNSVDSLSPVYQRDYSYMQPGITIRQSREKRRIEFALANSFSEHRKELKGDKALNEIYSFLLPSLSFEQDYSGGKRLGVSYESSVKAPEVSQLLPVSDRSDRLQSFTGNEYLTPEISHEFRLHWLNFDQFSFTSLFSNFFFTYTHNKINWSREVQPDLSQALTLYNVPDDYRASFSLEYSRPIRKLGLNVRSGVDETWNQGRSKVNGILNTQTNWEHAFSLSFDNRKKEKADISIGATLSLHSAKFSVQEAINQNYMQWTGFVDAQYSITAKWQFTTSMDITHYGAPGFSSAQTIPLLKAGLSRKVFKSNRGTITLEAFDILDKNSGVERTSEFNFLRERKSDTIGQYFLLSFKFRLNKFEKKDGIDIKVNGR